MLEGDKVIDILNNFFVKCLCCKKKFEINKDCFDYSSSSEERSMGPEITYEYEAECNCPECDNAIKVNITAIEYPVGGLNYSKNEICGAEFIDEPEVGIIYEEEFYYDKYELEPFYDPIEQLKKEILTMSPREFERYVCECFKNMGFEAELTKQTRDGGFDIICKKNSPFRMLLIVECKHYSSGNKVDVSIVRALRGVQDETKANKAICVTTSTFSRDAIEYADKFDTQMELVDMNGLLEWIKA